MTQSDQNFSPRIQSLDIALWVDAKLLANEAAFSRHLVMGLRSDGQTVTFITPASLPKHLNLSSLPLLGSRHLSYKWAGWEHLHMLKQMRMNTLIEDLTADTPDVLIVWAGADPAPLSVVQTQLNIPTIAWAWDAAELFSPLIAMPFVKQVVVSSQTILDRVPANWPHPVHLIRPGVFREETVACYDVDAQLPCIVSLDPLSDKDAYAPMLQACRTLANEGLDFLLFMYDTGRQESAIWQLAEKLNLLDRISFVPFHQEAEPLLLHGDLYLHVLPSTRVGYRTLDAMAKGLAVIARPNSAADYLLDQQTARLMERNTTEDWTLTLRDLLTHRKPTADLARRGQQLMADQHSISRTIEQITWLARQAAGTPIPMTIGSQ